MRSAKDCEAGAFAIAEEPVSPPRLRERVARTLRWLGDRDGPTREAALWALRLGAGGAAACYGTLMAGLGTAPLIAGVFVGFILASAYWIIAERAFASRPALAAAIAPALLLALWHPPMLGAWGLTMAWLAFSKTDALVPALRERPIATLLVQTVGVAFLALTAIAAGLGPWGAPAKPALAAATVLAVALLIALELAARLRAAFTFDVKRDALYRALGQRTVGLCLAAMLVLALFLTVCASLGLGASPWWLVPPGLAALVAFFAAVLFAERPDHPRAGAARQATRAFALLALVCLGPAPAVFYAMVSA